MLRALDEDLKVTRQGNIARVAAAINDPRARKEARDQPDQNHVIGQLVDHSQCASSETMEMRDMGVRGPPCGLCQIRAIFSLAVQLCSKRGDVVSLAGSEHARMARANLLDQCCP